LTLVKGSKGLLLADKKTKANSDAMRRAAEHLGVASPTARGVKADQELLGALRLEITKRLAKLPEDDHVKCVVCGEIATEDTEFCPYCGDEGSTSEADAKLAAALNAGPDDEDEEDAAARAEAAEAGDDDDAGPVPATGGDDDDEAESEDDDASDDDDEEEDEAEEDVVEDGDVQRSVGIVGEGAVVKNVGAGLKSMERDLVAALNRIKSMKQSAVSLSYDIGMECKAIRDQQLFKARGYKSFKDFAEKELPFTRESALQLIAIVEKYKRDDYAQIGYAKLRVIAAVNDPQAEEELITAAKKGATARELSERVTSGTAKKREAKPAPAVEKGERITLLGKVGSKKSVVKFHNSETGEIVPNAGIFSKKGFMPSAYAEHEISPGIFVRVGLRIGANLELEGLTVRFVRASE
jgi:hypothetical protein